MAEYVNLIDLLNKFDELVCPEFNLASDAGRMFLDCKRAIITTPTAVDVVDVVRCKDCVHCYYLNDEWGNEWYFCLDSANNKSVEANDYCSHGVRKEQEGK